MKPGFDVTEEERENESRIGSQPTIAIGHGERVLLSLVDMTVGFAGKGFVVPIVGLAFFFLALATPKVTPKTMALSIKMLVATMQNFFKDP